MPREKDGDFFAGPYQNMEQLWARLKKQYNGEAESRKVEATFIQTKTQHETL